MSSPFQAAMAAALVAVAVGVVAQPAASTRAVATASASGRASAPALGYRSAFAGYRPFTEQPVGSWRGANDVVGRIGGWQAYAREGQGGPVAGSASSPAASAGGMADMPGMRGHSMAATPSPSKGASGAMSGHKMP